MKGLVYLGNRSLELRDFPIPKPGYNEVVVKMEVAALCGSDLHVYRMDPKYMNAGIIAGHEPAGIVQEVGPAVANVNAGDRVSVFPHQGCGHCKLCLSGNMALCMDRTALGASAHGADAEYLLVKAQNCLPLPEELSFVDGAMIACQAGTGFSALKKTGVSPNDNLVIFGLGPVGLVTYLLARAMGARVIGIEIDSRRIELARRIGMSEVLDVDSDDCVERLREMTAGEGPNKIIETSGSVDAQRDAAEAAAIRGRIVLVGVSGPFYAPIETHMRPRSIIVKELQVLGSYMYNISDFFAVAELIRRQRIDFDPIITHRFPLAKAEEALKLFDQGGTGKIIFEF